MGAGLWEARPEGEAVGGGGGGGGDWRQCQDAGEQGTAPCSGSPEPCSPRRPRGPLAWEASQGVGVPGLDITFFFCWDEKATPLVSEGSSLLHLNTCSRILLAAHHLSQQGAFKVKDVPLEKGHQKPGQGHGVMGAQECSSLRETPQFWAYQVAGPSNSGRRWISEQ